ncbi:unnamed protein product [Tuber melanosporum]|uniref:(Perigord truffle) hypothetical protein n=1 Tax=Tuber melanosporum (strain Mel28) TaxID=656061 RepID=D5G9U7_TUBMM|nr:uncharacterized protein GSTUM_00005079001 [Tuber melanosporum]CAZ81290.1 unnamed protein product [Tuber melanosporum]
MASLDNLFKKPALPSSSSNSSKKRKLESSVDPVAAYKSAKLEAPSNDKGKSRAATVEEGDIDDTAGPSALPVNFFDNAGEEPEDEEGGRFFGGGVNKKTAEILDFMDERDRDDTAAASEKIDVAWLRRTALGFEKKINKNAEMRGKYEDDPHKFMASEADLDAGIKAISVLSEHPELFEEFRKLGCLASLVGLLAHENTDIAIDVVEVISELTDDEVEAEPEQWNAIVDGMIEAQLLEMLTQNLSRLNEGNESDRNGVYHTLSVFENLASQQSLAEQMVRETNITPYLLQRIQARESPISQNKQYAAELLAILLQSSPANRKKLSELSGTDVLLQLLSPYRKRDPVKGGDEEEFVENVFDCLTCVVDELEGKEAFVDLEGVELVLIMLREGKMSKPRALRLLDHAVGGQSGANVCQKLVDAAGLKTVFGMFMKKQDNQTTEHLLGIFAALLTHLPADSASRIRTLAKFVEKDYEKIAKLTKLRTDYALRVAKVDAEIAVQREDLGSVVEEEEMAEEWFSKRLDAGLFCLQMTDRILAWLCAEDDGAKKRIGGLLGRAGGSLRDVRRTLKEQIDGMTEASDEWQQVIKDMLSTLIEFL